MKNIKCYLDTNIISFIVRDDIPRGQKEALIRIYSFYEQGFIDCYTSETVKKELEEIPKKYKDQLDKASNIWMLFDKAKMFPTKKSVSGWGVAMWGEMPWGGGVERDDPIFKILSSIFDNIDAEHIFLCIKNNIPNFITYDKRSILSRASKHKKVLDEFGIKVLSPKEFEDNLG